MRACSVNRFQFQYFDVARLAAGNGPVLDSFIMFVPSDDGQLKNAM